MKRSLVILLLVSCLAIATAFSGCAAPKMPAGYRTTVGTGEDAITVVVVRGTPYEMGRAFGALMKDEINAGVNSFIAHSKKEAGPILSSDALFNSALDLAWKNTEPYVDERFKQELQGVADGSGVAFDTLRRGHMIPVIAPYSCSGAIAWGSATKDGHVYHFRNLDFTVDGGLQDVPVIAIYIPDQGMPHANVTFAGVISVNTGINAAGIALGEKGESPAREMPFKTDGEHFMTLFRRVLYDARTLDEALEILKSAKRIKKYYWYVSDGKAGGVKIKAFAPDMKIWRGGDPTDELAPNIIPDVVYHSIDNKTAYSMLSKPGVKHDADSMIAISRAVASDDGNLLNVVYDATDLVMYVAYAEKKDPASKRPYVRVNLKDYLGVHKLPKDAVVYNPPQKSE